MIKPYLSDIINDHKKSTEVTDYETQFGEWKIQLTMQMNFISSKDSGETCTMYVRSCNIKIIMGSETNDIIEELRESLQKYQEGLEESMRGSEFVCDSMDLLYYHLHRLSLSLRRKIRSIMMRLRNQVI